MACVYRALGRKQTQSIKNLGLGFRYGFSVVLVPAGHRGGVAEDRLLYEFAWRNGEDKFLYNFVPRNAAGRALTDFA